jgi:hypothetical protein
LNIAPKPSGLLNKGIEILAGKPSEGDIHALPIEEVYVSRLSN